MLRGRRLCGHNYCNYFNCNSLKEKQTNNNQINMQHIRVHTHAHPAHTHRAAKIDKISARLRQMGWLTGQVQRRGYSGANRNCNRKF